MWASLRRVNVGGPARRIRSRALAVAATVVTVALLAGLTTACDRQAADNPAVVPEDGAPTQTARPVKVLTIIEENKTAKAALDGMPYLAAMAATHGYTTRYQAVTHPSLPNYLALVGGSTFGVTDDDPPSSHRITGPSIFGRALDSGHTAKAYIESMPMNCAQSDSVRYAVRHNPWAYFVDPAEQAACLQYDVPAGTPTAGALYDDVRSGILPTVGLLVPNMCNDAHDCDLETADRWLRRWLPVLMAGPDYRSGRLAIVVTFDENDNSRPNTVLTTVIARSVHGVVSALPYSHYSWTRYICELIGVPPLREAAGPGITSLARGFYS